MAVNNLSMAVHIRLRASLPDYEFAGTARSVRRKCTGRSTSAASTCEAAIAAKAAAKPASKSKAAGKSAGN